MQVGTTRWVVTLASVALVAVGAMAPRTAALAQTGDETIVYTLEGVTFDDGGTATGQFTFDPTMSCALTCPEAYHDVSVTTTAGSTLPGTIYAAPGITETSGSALLEMFIRGTGPDLGFAFMAPLGSALSLTFDTARSGEDTPSMSRSVVSGRVIGVKQDFVEATTTIVADDAATTTTVAKPNDELPLTGGSGALAAVGAALALLGGVAVLGSRYQRHNRKA